MKKLLPFAALVLVFFILTATACFAGPDKDAASIGQQEGQGFDIVLLMDSSGSMKKTDPRDYRKDSARLFISLLNSNDKVGVVSFGDSARTLIPLTPNTKNNRAALFSAVGKISSREFSTDITGAVRQGLKELQSSNNKNRVLILMSDGKLALGDPQKDEASLAELAKLLPEVKAAGIRIYSIAFSELSDPKLLGDIAEKTGGFFRYAEADKDIHVMFASIFEKIKSPDSVALQGDSFTIDKDIREAVLLITKQAGTVTVLSDPSGKKNIQGRSAKNIQWYGSNVFDMITIQGPAAGQWKVKLSSREGNRIFVLTNLKLKSSFEKNSVNKGDNIVLDAWLEKDGKRITEKEVLDQVRFSAELIGSDGKAENIPLAGTADPGVFAQEFIAGQSGDYKVRLSAEGKTFNRAKEILFKAVEPPPPAVVQAGTAERPAPQPVEQTDWKKTLMLLGLVDIILLVLAAALFTWGRRYKRMYIAAKKLPPAPADLAPADLAPAEVPKQEELASEEESHGEMPEVEEKIEESASRDELVIPETEKPAESSESVEAKTEAAGKELESERVNKLLGIIDFQKNKIAELMLVKDVIENARLRIGALPARSREANDKLRTAAESHGLADEMSSSLSAIEDDAGELLSYVMVLEKEESRLTERFIQWEEGLKKLLEGEEYVPSAVTAGTSESTGADLREGSAEKIAELEAEISELEDQLMSKDRKMKALEQQYEDIEKEYMILYHAAQKQKQQQPDI